MRDARTSGVAVVALLALGTSAGPVGRRSSPATEVVLWGWERPEDLRFIDTEHFAVAFLAATVRLQGASAAVRLRVDPLQVPGGTRLTAVVRIEARAGAALSAPQQEACVQTLLRCARLPDVSAVQVDFDARQSQRAFYRSLLGALRQRLPRETPISITALASWCLDDPWIADLHVSEAVPMLFRIGAEAASIRERLARGDGFRVASCRDSAGVSLDEPPIRGLPRIRRVYVFNPKAWRPETVALAALRSSG